MTTIDGSTCFKWEAMHFVTILQSVFKSEIGCQFFKKKGIESFFGIREIILHLCEVDNCLVLNVLMN